VITSGVPQCKEGRIRVDPHGRNGLGRSKPPGVTRVKLVQPNVPHTEVAIPTSSYQELAGISYDALTGEGVAAILPRILGLLYTCHVYWGYYTHATYIGVTIHRPRILGLLYTGHVYWTTITKKKKMGNKQGK